MVCQQSLGYTAFDEYIIHGVIFPDTTLNANSERDWGGGGCSSLVALRAKEKLCQTDYRDCLNERDRFVE